MATHETMARPPGRVAATTPDGSPRSVGRAGGAHARFACSALRSAWLLGLAIGITIAGVASAQWPTAIEPLGPADTMKSQRQREQVDTLARRRLGTPLHDGALSDLDVLQRLLDEGIVGTDDAFAQQSLGLALGDVMARNLPLEWVVVDDDVGRSRALRHRDTRSLFFPVTMISKRMTRGDRVSVRALYEDVAGEVEALERRSRPTRSSTPPPDGASRAAGATPRSDHAAE